jgi:hypothetical protein
MVNWCGWDDKPVFLIGGGTSLRGLDFSALRSTHAYVVGVNQAIFDAPVCAGFSADSLFIEHRAGQLQRLVARGIEIVLAPGAAPGSAPGAPKMRVPGAIYLTRKITSGLSSDPTIVHSIGSSGYAAINLAVLKHARRIVLFGFDYHTRNGEHYHDHFPWYWQHSGWSTWAQGYESMLPALRAAGVEVINASPTSAITCFLKLTIEDALAWSQQITGRFTSPKAL